MNKIVAVTALGILAATAGLSSCNCMWSALHQRSSGSACCNWSHQHEYQVRRSFRTSLTVVG